MNMKRIHVCAQTYYRRTVADFQAGNQARTTDTSVNLEPHGDEYISNIVRGFDFFETYLRVLMKVVAPAHKLLVKIILVNH